MTAVMASIITAPCAVMIAAVITASRTIMIIAAVITAPRTGIIITVLPAAIVRRPCRSIRTILSITVTVDITALIRVRLRIDPPVIISCLACIIRRCSLA
jgi:hypothetical protein